MCVVCERGVQYVSCFPVVRGRRRCREEERVVAMAVGTRSWDVGRDCQGLVVVCRVSWCVGVVVVVGPYVV